MSNSFFPNLVERISNGVPWVVAIAFSGLLALAGALVVTARVNSEGRRLTIGEAAWTALSLFWAAPVAGVLALVVLRSAHHFQEPVISRAEVPEAVDARLVEPDEPKGDDDNPTGAAAKTSSLPEWARTPVVRENDKTLLVLVSSEQPTRADAEEELAAKAVAKVREDFEQAHPTAVPWSVPKDAVRFTLVHEEKIPHKTEKVSFTMVRLYRQLEISPQTRAAADAAWKQAVVADRVRGLGGILGMVALTVAASAMYLRLDQRTGGTCRGRLKTATVATIVAGGLIAAALV